MIFVAGSTGFVGGHLVKALKAKGFNVRCLIRSEKKADTSKSLGFEIARGDITDRESLRGSLEGVHSVVHLVGIIRESGEQTFEKIHIEGTRNLVDEAKAAGVKFFFFQSALGASLQSPHKYSKTKAVAEGIVRESAIAYTIFRPSLIIGPGDGFTKSVQEVLRLGPVVTVPGKGEAFFQPIYIEDWIRCFIQVLDDQHRRNKVFEVGGPEHLTYNEMMRIMMREFGVQKPVVHVPLSLVKAGLPFTRFISSLTKGAGMNIPEVSAEQLDLLQLDNITDTDVVETFFGFKPVRFEEAVRRVFP
jgi:NADH dehydrogenase